MVEDTKTTLKILLHLGGGREEAFIFYLAFYYNQNSLIYSFFSSFSGQFSILEFSRNSYLSFFLGKLIFMFYDILNSIINDLFLFLKCFTYICLLIFITLVRKFKSNFLKYLIIFFLFVYFLVFPLYKYISASEKQFHVIILKAA